MACQPHAPDVLDPHAPPNTIVNDRMNLWQGFAVQPEKGDADWFVEHVSRLFDGNQQIVDYVLDWLARGIQNPGRPIGTAIVMIGKEGAGKGVLGNLACSLYGVHGITIANREELLGRFNSHLRAAAFAFIDEPPFAGSKADADVLKHMITEPTIGIEATYQDREEVPNLLKLLVATNHAWAAQVSLDDRRFAVFEVVDAGDKTYFDAFRAHAGSRDGKRAVLHYLLNRDIAGFDPERHRPVTAAYVGQKLASLSEDWLFWRSVCEQQRWPGKGAVWEPIAEAGGYRKADILKRYNDWHYSTNQRGNPVTGEQFWKNARRWMGDQLVEERPRMDGDRPRLVRIPGFADLASRFFSHFDAAMHG